MQRVALFALWFLASLSFVASLGLVWIAWFWMMWGAGGDLRDAYLPPFYVLIFLTPFTSAAIAALAYRARSKSMWPPVSVTLLLPLVWGAGFLIGE
ncbi:hypothetical protein [Brevundimonas sp. R86498]|uniref:hypothetical protein n=1 Tax=Brevundimonas sp. R86498 TaxID=3093845 RepID=UPI0037C9EAA6